MQGLRVSAVLRVIVGWWASDFNFWVDNLIFRRCFYKKIYFCKWQIGVNDCDFESFKIITLLKCIFLHKPVGDSLLELGRLCHYSIKIIFFGYLKTLSLEIIQKWMATCGM